MSLISMILYCWHYIRKSYLQELIKGCLDQKLKADLINKFEFHKKKVDQLSSRKEGS